MMGDYDFLSNEAEAIKKRKPQKVKFLDVELPETSNVSAVAIVREKMVKGDQQISAMEKEAEGFSLTGQAGFDNLTEMIGQVKTLEKLLTEAVEIHTKPIYARYKELRNILTQRTNRLKKLIEGLQKKQNQIGYQMEMERRERERKAREEAAKLQAKLDREQAELDKKEKARAKKEGREPELQKPIVVDAPTIPKETKTVTESGSAKIEMVLVATIQNPDSPFVFKKIQQYFPRQYMELANKAMKKAIDEGVLGIKGADGVTVEEKASTKHRRR